MARPGMLVTDINLLHWVLSTQLKRNPFSKGIMCEAASSNLIQINTEASSCGTPLTSQYENKNLLMDCRKLRYFKSKTFIVLLSLHKTKVINYLKVVKSSILTQEKFWFEVNF